MAGARQHRGRDESRHIGAKTTIVAYATRKSEYSSNYLHARMLNIGVISERRIPPILRESKIILSSVVGRCALPAIVIDVMTVG